MTLLRILSIFVVLMASFNSQSQHFRGYYETTPGHKLEFDTHEYIDTIWRYRDSVFPNPERKTYVFTATNVGKEPVHCGYSRRLGGGDPDFNCSNPKIIEPNKSDQFKICFPGRVFSPPFVLTRKYIANSTSEKRDTLTIKRVFVWADRDTTHDVMDIGAYRVNMVEHIPKMSDPILFVNLHEDEQTSIEALKQYASTQTISYFYLEHEKERRIAFKEKEDSISFDPNRIFTDNGLVSTVEDKEMHTPEAEKLVKWFARRLIWRINNKEVIIALHNNTDTNYSIHSYMPDSSEALNTGLLYINPEMDPDDFIYTTDQEVFETMVANKVNAILQDKETFVDDGSLSIYCGINKIRYVNIETQHGHLEKQLELMKLVHEIFKH